MRVSLGFELELHQPQTQLPSIQDLQRSLESISTNQTHLHMTQNSILEQLSNKLKPSLNLNFPVFHGGRDNPLDWLSLAVRYFKYLATPEADKVEVASLHLKGTATPWMDWYESKHGLGSWEHFECVFLNTFGPPGMGYLDYNGSLIRLKLKGSLEDYVAEFLRLSCKVSPICWTEEDLMSQFLEGLKDQRVRDLVESLEPESLYDAVEMARVANSGGPLLFMQL